MHMYVHMRNCAHQVQLSTPTWDIHHVPGKVDSIDSSKPRLSTLQNVYQNRTPKCGSHSVKLRTSSRRSSTTKVLLVLAWTENCDEIVPLAKLVSPKHEPSRSMRYTKVSQRCVTPPVRTRKRESEVRACDVRLQFRLGQKCSTLHCDHRHQQR